MFDNLEDLVDKDFSPNKLFSKITKKVFLDFAYAYGMLISHTRRERKALPNGIWRGNLMRWIPASDLV